MGTPGMVSIRAATPSGTDLGNSEYGGTDVLPLVANLLDEIKQVVAETPTSRIPEGVKVRVELTSNGGRYFIYRYTDRATKKRKAIYGGKSSTLSAERIAQYEKRRKKQTRQA